MSTDFLDFDIDNMYFDTPLPEKAEALINEAAEEYGSELSELLLLRAYLLAPEHLTVMVALYRYYYYQCRLEDALTVVMNAIRTSGNELHLNHDWRKVTETEVAAGAYRSVGIVRFYLLALKAAGFVKLRIGDIEEGKEMLRKVISHDPNDRLKTVALLDVVESYTRKQECDVELMVVAGGKL
jgi:tetratricopeptide (TPR) repeat protein